MAKRKSAYRDFPPPLQPYYGYSPYTMTQNYTILALDPSTNQWRHITNYAQGGSRQDAVERYYRNTTSTVPTEVMVFPSESGRRMKQPAPKPQWEEIHLV